MPDPQPPTTNLPRSRDAFIGRAADIAQLAEALSTTARLVTLKGTGGVGKTRLAQHFGRIHQHRYPAGVWFVDLTEARSAEDMLQMVAVVLRETLRGTGPDQSAAEQVGDALAQRGRVLLILDNVEQITSVAAELLAVWMDRAGDARFMVTSRHPLQMRGERVFSLSPLAEDEGIHLFADRARMSGATWVDGSPDTAQMQQLMQHLDCLPLAIELVAARAKQFSLDGLRDLLGVSHKLLSSQRRDRPPRQRTVADLVQWSWELLEEWEQRALLQLSVFKGGFDLDSATAVIELSAWPDAPWAPDVVGRLLDHSLVFVDNTSRQRYRMYSGVRDFCAHHGTASSVGAETILGARRRHARHFARFGEQAFQSRLQLHAGQSLHGRLHGELQNLIAAVDTSLEAEQIDQAGLCALACAFIYEAQGPVGASAVVLQRVIDTAEAPSHTRSRVYRALAYAEFLMGRFERAEQGYERSYHDARLSSPDDEAAAHTLYLYDIARVHTAEGRLKLAMDCFEEIVTGFEEQGHHDSLIRGLINQSDLCLQLGEFERARRSIDEARRLGGPSRGDRREVICLMNLGEIALAQQDPASAMTWFEQALALASSLEDSKNAGILMGLLGEAHALQGDTARAITLLEEAIHHRASAIPVRDTVRFRSALAVLLARLGDTQTPRRLLDHSLVEHSMLPKLGQVRLLCMMAQVAHMLGEPDRGQTFLGQAMALTQPLELSAQAPARALLQATKQLLDASGDTPPALVAHADGDWFRLGEGELTWLIRRRALRQIFAALVRAHRSTPGVGLSLDELIGAGWGDEHILEEARRARVYTAVSTLRRLGLGKRLQRESDGYRLDPDLAVVVSTQTPSRR